MNGGEESFIKEIAKKHQYLDLIFKEVLGRFCTHSIAEYFSAAVQGIRLTFIHSLVALPPSLF